MNPRELDIQAPGHYGNQQNRQEQFQRTKDQAPTDEAGQIGNASAKPDPDNNLGRGTPDDREDRIRQRAHEIWEREGRPDGQAEQHWERAAQDLDREDLETPRAGEQRNKRK